MTIRSGSAASVSKIDEIVAKYAPIGSQRRRQRRVRNALFGGGLVAVVAVSTWLVSLGLVDLSRSGPSHDVAAGEVSRVADRLGELEIQLARVERQALELDRQRAELDAQSARLAAMLDEAVAARSDLTDSNSQGSKLDEEIAAMAAQREALAERWAQFEAQGELLAMEIVAVNAQRKELESQRRLIEQQRKEMQKLLDQATELYRRNVRARGTAPEPEATSTHTEAFVAAPESLMVNAKTLSEMRGGFSIGEGLDISFGFEQTGFVNGEEQFRNNFTIDSLAGGISNVDLSNMNSVVLQNGNGNFVGAGVFDALESSFGSVIQNTLDNQVISTESVYDISLHNMPNVLQGLAGEQALTDTLGGF